MKTNNIFKLFAFVMISTASAFLVSCDDENRVTVEDSKDIAEDALTDSYYEDTDDMAGIALQADANASGNGRTAGKIRLKIADSRMICDSVILEPDPTSTPQTPKGVITVDFGTACTDNKGNTRSGKLIFTYSGKKFMPGSTVVLTTDNYYINGIKLEGTRTLKNISGSDTLAPKFEVVLKDGKAIFPDGSEALRQSTFIREWIRAANPLNDQLKVMGTASGLSRQGRKYTMNIQEELVFQRSCLGLPVAGVKIFVVDGKEITIDYGSGECDRSVTYTVNGNSRTTTVNKN